MYTAVAAGAAGNWNQHPRPIFELTTYADNVTFGFKTWFEYFGKKAGSQMYVKVKQHCVLKANLANYIHGYA